MKQNSFKILVLSGFSPSYIPMGVETNCILSYIYMDTQQPQHPLIGMTVIRWDNNLDPLATLWPK